MDHWAHYAIACALVLLSALLYGLLGRYILTTSTTNVANSQQSKSQTVHTLWHLHLWQLSSFHLLVLVTVLSAILFSYRDRYYLTDYKLLLVPADLLLFLIVPSVGYDIVAMVLLVPQDKLRKTVTSYRLLLWQNWHSRVHKTLVCWTLYGVLTTWCIFLSALRYRRFIESVDLYIHSLEWAVGIWVLTPFLLLCVHYLYKWSRNALTDMVLLPFDEAAFAYLSHVMAEHHIETPYRQTVCCSTAVMQPPELIRFTSRQRPRAVTLITLCRYGQTNHQICFSNALIQLCNHAELAALMLHATYDLRGLLQRSNRGVIREKTLLRGLLYMLCGAGLIAWLVCGVFLPLPSLRFLPLFLFLAAEVWTVADRIGTRERLFRLDEFAADEDGRLLARVLLKCAVANGQRPLEESSGGVIVRWLLEEEPSVMERVRRIAECLGEDAKWADELKRECNVMETDV